VAWVCVRSIPTERPSLGGEVNANLCGNFVYSFLLRLMLLLPSFSCTCILPSCHPAFTPPVALYASALHCNSQSLMMSQSLPGLSLSACFSLILHHCCLVPSRQRNKQHEKLFSPTCCVWSKRSTTRRNERAGSSALMRRLNLPQIHSRCFATVDVNCGFACYSVQCCSSGVMDVMDHVIMRGTVLHVVSYRRKFTPCSKS
jgi:hypothetical protein